MQALAEKSQALSVKAEKLNYEKGKSQSHFQLRARRFFYRAEAKVETLPRFFASFFSLALIGGFSVYGAALGGHLDALGNHTMAGLGFDVEAVEITGHHYMNEQDILDVLGVQTGLPLITFDVQAAHQTLLREPWVKSASVRKLFPDRLQIELEERRPFAVWQRGHVKSIVDQDGLVLDAFHPASHAGLPLLVGHGAQDKGAEFLALLNEFPELAERVRATTLHSKRRWDLLLDNDITVKLPEHNIRAALNELSLLDAENDLLAKDVVSIDMRLADRLVVRLSDDALLRRQATLKQRDLKRAKGKRI